MWCTLPVGSATDRGVGITDSDAVDAGAHSLRLGDGDVIGRVEEERVVLVACDADLHARLYRGRARRDALVHRRHEQLQRHTTTGTMLVTGVHVVPCLTTVFGGFHIKSCTPKTFHIMSCTSETFHTMSRMPEIFHIISRTPEIFHIMSCAHEIFHTYNTQGFSRAH